MLSSSVATRQRAPWRPALLCLAALAVLSAPCHAQSGRSSLGAEPSEWEFPTEAAFWINSPPLTREALSGKGVVMVFFEEQCSECAERWPAAQQMASRYAEQPVLFLAVNSGTAPDRLKAYARRYRVAWPMVADVDRSLEKALGVPMLVPPANELRDRRQGGGSATRLRLELERRAQASNGPSGPTSCIKYLSGAGELGEGDPAQFEDVVSKALEGAEWRVDPTGIPKQLRPAWRSIEIGAFGEAGASVMKALKKDGPLKSGAELLFAAVQEELNAEADAIRTSLSEGEQWQAYKQLGAFVERYEPYGRTKTAETKRDELKKLPAIKDEITAGKALEKAIRTGSKGTDAAVRRAQGMLERLVQSSPTTEAAERAREILATL